MSTELIREAEPFKAYFEVSWEIANKVGGIYTVIKTKTANEMAYYTKHGYPYYLVGPYNIKSVQLEVEECDPEFPIISETIQCIRQEGIKVVYGKWLIEGNPSVILLDVGSAYWKMDTWRKEFWELCKIGIPDSDTEAKDSVIFGYLTAWLITEFTCRLPGRPTVCALFHEWQAGIGGVLLRMWNKPVAVIFHTHATLIGRYLCAANVDFYNNLPNFVVDKESGERGIYHRYCLERVCAIAAHIFTTVSQNTGEECEHLLKRKPDLIMPNGLNVREATAQHEFQNLHNHAKCKIHNFVRSHFYGHMDFDLDNTLYFFNAGRYEYANKGVDLYIESLAKLNFLLKESNSTKTVIAFLIFPAPTNNFNVDALKGLAVVKQMKDTITEIQEKIGIKLFNSALKGLAPDSNNLLDSDDLVQLKRCILATQRDSLPPIVTHNMLDDENDPILTHLRRVNLFNRRSDRVKVVFHPQFVDATNPLFNMDYDEFVRGCHLGVFPSYYEPWGYTPAECTIRGIPSVTTNVSGYGLYMADHIAEPANYGVYIVDRRLKAPWESVEQLAGYMYKFTQMTRKNRIIQRNRCERLSDLLSWTSLTRKYHMANNMALCRAFPDIYELEKTADTSLMHKSSSIFFPHPYSEPATPNKSRSFSFSDFEGNETRASSEHSV